ncbi:MAG: nitrous oxide-stimulated promoter family protein [Planctomycetes bacterium]|nr:nitrous oxide-stimulated promoter family protein [Planctomycetota bacterium]
MTKRPDKMQREKKTIAVMVGIFCADKHDSGKGELCSNCRALLDYADQRLDKCPFGADKGPCRKCEIHCYKPEMRDRVREVMAYAGPRMIKKHPVLAVKHLLDGRKGKSKKKEDGK